MNDELARSFTISQTIYDLSLEKNKLNANHLLSILTLNKTLESLELKKNHLPKLDLIEMAQITIDHRNLTNISVSIENIGADNHVSEVLNEFLKNQVRLSSITLHSLDNSTLPIKNCLSHKLSC